MFCVQLQFYMQTLVFDSRKRKYLTCSWNLYNFYENVADMISSQIAITLRNNVACSQIEKVLVDNNKRVMRIWEI